MSMEDGELAEETLDSSGPRGVLSSRTPNTNKKEREEALKELLLKSKAKADLRRIRKGFRATFDENATLMNDQCIARDHKKQEMRLTMTEKGTDTDKLRQSRMPDSHVERSRVHKPADKNFNMQQSAPAIRKDTLATGFGPQTGGDVLRTAHNSSDASRRRLKKLSDFSGSKEEGTRSKEDVTDSEDPPYKAQSLVSDSQTGTMLKEDRGQHYGGRCADSDDLIGQLGYLSIGKQGKDRDKSIGRPLKKSNDFNWILKVSRQQSLPDEDVAITEPQRKQWTDWPEPSRQGESRKSAYVDLDKWEKHQGREHAGGVRVSDGRAPTVQSVDHSSRRGEHLLHQGVQEFRKQTGKVQSLEVDLSERPAQRTPSASGVSASSSEEREAREAKGRERVEAILAKDRNALVLGKGRYVLPGRVASQLYPHQRESIEWLWSLHVKKTGGILGDDMGLGKTMQIASYLTGLFHSRLIRCVLVVAPKTLLAQWELELTDKCRLGRQVLSYHEGSLNERARNLRHTLQHGGILLTTYGMIQHNTIPLSGQDPGIGKDGYGEMADDIVTWDYVVLDEGHQIKNEKTVKAKNLRSIPARHRLIVSGTPVQNNLQEMWSLFDFCCPGLLGDSRFFKEEYERKITTGQNRDASERQRHVGIVTSQKLRSVIAPFFLRREKKDVIKTPNPDAGAIPASSVPDPKAHGTGQRQMDMSAQKNDLIVWLKPTPEQKRLYVSFLQSEQVKKVFNEKRSALAALTVLKKICDHPLLLTERAASEIARGASRAGAHAVADGRADLSVDELTEGDAAAAAEMALAIARARGISLGEGSAAKETSCKVLFLMELLEDLVWNGHRTLVFSQSKKMLDIIQVEVVARNFRFCRIDGGIVSAKERQKLVQEFQTDPDIPVFLLTSQVGGLGLTLTAADRVVIIDPAWNPSVDNQSVDRAYRIGQKRDVVVYRLITSGTIEEKIYCKQVFKGGLMRAVTEHKDYKKMFNEHELTALFSIPERGFEYSETMERLHKSQAGLINTTPELNQHISRLETRGIVGVSHHDLLFKEEAEDVPIVATVDTFTARPTSAAFRRQVVDLTARGSRKGGLTSRPTPSGARVERIDLLSEAHAYLRSDSESGFKGLGGSSANPWTVPEEVSERSAKQKEAEMEAAAKRRMEALAQELKKAERLLNTQALSLPDGGEKIKQKIRRLSDQLSEAQVAATKPLSPELPKGPQPTPLNGQTAGTQNPDSNPQNPNPQTLKLQTSNPWRPNPQDPSPQLLEPQIPANTQRVPLEFNRGGALPEKAEGHVPPKTAKMPGEANLEWESSNSSLSSGEGYASASSAGWCSDAASCHGGALESNLTVAAELLHANGRSSERPKFQRDHRNADIQREPRSVDFQKGPRVAKSPFANLQTDQTSEGLQMDPERAGLQTGRRMQRDPWGVDSVARFERDPWGVGSRKQNEWAEELAAKVAAFSSSIVLPPRDHVQKTENDVDASSQSGETGLTAKSNPVGVSGKNSSSLVATAEGGRASLLARKDAEPVEAINRTDGAESKQAPVKLALGNLGESAKGTSIFFKRPPEVLDGAVGSEEKSGGGFETPARCGAPQGPQSAGPRGPQSGLKLRASLRKRREEGAAVNDSPPGGMPTFDLGLDDMDDVADKLGSMSVT